MTLRSGHTVDVVGKSKIAKRLGVSTSTVDYWRKHNGFPEPVSTVSVVESGPGSYPVWLWSDVQRWAGQR
jgi:predicted DNA-binding transcriptional regulator AlpA